MHSNMALRLSDTLLHFVLFSLHPSLKTIVRQKKITLKIYHFYPKASEPCSNHWYIENGLNYKQVFMMLWSWWYWFHSKHRHTTYYFGRICTQPHRMVQWYFYIHIVLRYFVVKETTKLLKGFLTFLPTADSLNGSKLLDELRFHHAY